MAEYNVSAEYFSEISRMHPAHICALSLPETFPDYFVQTTKLPRAIKEIWKPITDKHCKDVESKYFFDKDKATIQLYYAGLPESAAKSKNNQLERMLKDALEEYLKTGEVPNVEEPISDQSTKEKHRDEKLVKVMKEGLRKGPGIEEVRYWSERAFQYYTMQNDMPDYVRKLVDDYKFPYVPVLNAENSMIIGSVLEVNPKGINSKRAEDAMRDNMAQINAAHLELARMAQLGQKALVMVPLDARIFIDKKISDFIVMSMKKIPSELRKFLVVEIRGLGGKKISPPIAEQLGTLSILCRSLVVETGILSCPDFSRHNFKPYAYSFNFLEVKLPEEQLLALMKKYANFYKKLGAKTMIRNIPNKNTLLEAIKMGHTFLSGPMVFSPRLKCALPTKIS